LIAFQPFYQALHEQLPEADIDVDGPSVAGWYDLLVTIDTWTLRVEVRPDRGIGLATPRSDHLLGEGVDEVYNDSDEAVRRISALAESRGQTIPPPVVQLQRAREASGMTQEQIARALGIQQAAVSRLEHRDNPTVQSLARLIRAMGGQLEIAVKIGSQEFPLVFSLGDLSDRG
jgi:DNA-binding XRE family transcriptional regulator